MKSSKLVELKPVRSIASIPDAIAAATYILTGEARKGLSVNSVLIEKWARIDRRPVDWLISFYSVGDSDMSISAPTFWHALYQLSELHTVDFSQYEVLESSPMGVQYDSRRKGLSQETRTKENKGRRQSRQAGHH